MSAATVRGGIFLPAPPSVTVPPFRPDIAFIKPVVSQDTVVGHQMTLHSSGWRSVSGFPSVRTIPARVGYQTGSSALLTWTGVNLGPAMAVEWVRPSGGSALISTLLALLPDIDDNDPSTKFAGTAAWAQDLSPTVTARLTIVNSSGTLVLECGRGNIRAVFIDDSRSSQPRTVRTLFDMGSGKSVTDIRAAATTGNFWRLEIDY